jgi:hypothetical protein
MASFSERLGITPPKLAQIDSMDDELRSSLWNVCRKWFFISDDYLTSSQKSRVHRIYQAVYAEFYKRPVDNIPKWSSEFVEETLQLFMTAKWYDVYNLIEFLYTKLWSPEDSNKGFSEEINSILALEKAGYCLNLGIVTPLTNKVEISSVNASLSLGDRFNGVSTHIHSALVLYSRKPNPDYRNSIKESISAVEAACKIITNDPKETLGSALKIIRREHDIHSSFINGMTSLYGYTSDKGGIRHAMMDYSNIDEADARYMLVICSAFTNYIISRCSKSETS